jgi:pimeloyl-ACP methyl ester carboxylesterase
MHVIQELRTTAQGDQPDSRYTLSESLDLSLQLGWNALTLEVSETEMTLTLALPNLPWLWGDNYIFIRNHYMTMKIIPLMAALGLMLMSCLPIPQVYLPPKTLDITYRIPLQEVSTNYVSIDGFDEPSTPSMYNKALYQRYYADQNPNVILVLMPGFYGGAGSFDLLARQLVAAIPKLEVWAIDRRANLLEDRSAMQEAIRQRNPQLAQDYYIKNLAQDNGFKVLTPQELSFMAQWGLDVHLRDLHHVIKRAREYAPTVILGGHSLGGSLIDYYAAYQFEDGVGYGFLDGLIQLDGVLGRTGGFNRPPEGLRIAGVQIVPGLTEIEGGDANPFFPLLSTPQNFAKRETMSLFARFDPQGLSPFTAFPASNLAAIAMSDDDEYAMSTVFSASMGDSIGAVYGGNIVPVILGGSQGFYSRSVIGVAGDFERVDWVRDNPADEAVNPEALVEAWGNQDTNRSEWYFPLRLALEVGQYDVELENTPGFTPSRLVTTPTLAVGAGRGLVTTLEGFAAYSNARVGSSFAMYIIPDFTHLDILYAEQNPLVGIFKMWMQHTLGIQLATF